MADKKLTVYFTSDLHGYIYPTDYRSRDERGHRPFQMREPL